MSDLDPETASAPQDGALRLEIDGEQVEPDTIDARRTLELAAAYFELLTKIASSRGSVLELRGLRVENKCVALRSLPNSADVAREAATEADDYISGREEPVGVMELVKRVRAARRALPPGHSAKVIIGPWECPITAVEDAPEWPPYATISLRAEVVRAGGARPRARFRSDSEPDEFTLDVSEATARELGAHLYREVDITAHVHRDENDRIRGGQLEEFFPLEDGGAREAWRQWVQDNAPHWFEVDDLDSELRADDGEDENG